MINRVLFKDALKSPSIKQALAQKEQTKQPPKTRVEKKRFARPYSFKPKPQEAPMMDERMARSHANAMRLTQSQLDHQNYKGPYIAGYSPERRFLSTISNQTHSASTNNGYARKQSGGFYFH